MRARAAALLLALLPLAGCDRFAGDPRGVVVAVRDANGTPLQGVEVHAVLYFEPPFDLPSTLPLAFTLPTEADVIFEAFRKSDGVRAARGSLGRLAAGDHDLAASDLALPNGVYRVRVQTATAVVRDADVVLNRVPAASGRQPYLTRTPANGEAFVSAEALSMGVTATVQPGEAPVALTVTDSVTFVFARPGRSPQQHGIRLPADGLTRLEAVLD